MERVLATDLYKADLFGKTMYIILNTDSNDQTDAIQRQPDLTVPINESGRVGYYQSATDTAVERHWRKKLGKWLYQDILKEEMARRGIGKSLSDLLLFRPATSSPRSGACRGSETGLNLPGRVPSALHPLDEEYRRCG